uniref:Uncharacterized protein n=1 Tax=Gasterosteus aculeatus aculeatus TaxID=481459 RepID=G3N8T1_GASAC
MKAGLSVLLALVVMSSAFGKYVPKSGKRIPQTLSRGWGDQLIWAQTYEEALYWARSRNKPLMVLFHLEDCPHSHELRKVLSEDNGIQKMLDEDFVVLNLMYETTDKHLSPDGQLQWMPRVQNEQCIIHATPMAEMIQVIVSSKPGAQQDHCRDNHHQIEPPSHRTTVT